MTASSLSRTARAASTSSDEYCPKALFNAILEEKGTDPHNRGQKIVVTSGD